MVRPNLESIFFRELRDDFLLNKNIDFQDDRLFVQPELREWLEEISLDEIYLRQDELRPDLRLIIADIKNNENFDELVPDFNPFSLTDTRIQLFNSESDMRLSGRILKCIPIISECIDDIRKLENTITLQFFIDDQLIETIEFK